MCSSKGRYTIFLELLIIFFLLIPKVNASVVINEIFPNPVGSNEIGEWIELYNLSPHAVDISGFTLDDAPDQSDPFIIASGSSIASHAFLTFDKKQTGIALNNTGDIIRIIDPSGQILDSYTYSFHPEEDRSYGRSEDGSGQWVVCNQATPNIPNICILPSVTLAPSSVPTQIPTPTNTLSPTKVPTITYPSPTPFTTTAPTKTIIDSQKVMNLSGNVLSAIDNNSKVVAGATKDTESTQAATPYIPPPTMQSFDITTTTLSSDAPQGRKHRLSKLFIVILIVIGIISGCIAIITIRISSRNITNRHEG